MNERPDMRPAPGIRLPWSRSERLVPRRVLRPLQEFLATSVASGILLVLAAIAAVVWASWPWGSGYEAFWRTPAEARVGTWTIGVDVRHWVNEGLMTLFFLLVGLEIKREVLTGELRRLRVALLPVIVAVSGMAVPALIYLAFVRDGGGAGGWAIPMATDLVFGLGVLALVGASVPGGLRSLLLALAIVDDIGSVLVLTIVSPSDTAPFWFAISSGLAAIVFLLPRIHVRSSAVYVCLGVAIWFALDRSGVHPTIAGVVMGLLTPAQPFQRPRAVSDEARRTADETSDDPPRPDADAHQWLRLAELSREAVSPLARIEHLLLPWVSFVVVPLFVVANVGVRLTPTTIAAAAGSAVAWAIVAARVGGKLVGIWGGATLAGRLGIADVPAGVRPAHLAGMAAAAGAGFTVSLFVAEVVFGSDSPLLAHVKVALLSASIVSAIVGYGVLRRVGTDARASRAAAEVT